MLLAFAFVACSSDDGDSSYANGSDSNGNDNQSSYSNSYAGHYKGSLSSQGFGTLYMVFTLTDSGKWVSHGYKDAEYKESSSKGTWSGNFTYSAGTVSLDVSEAVGTTGVTIGATSSDGWNTMSVSGGFSGTLTKISSIDYTPKSIAEYRATQEVDDGNVTNYWSLLVKNSTEWVLRLYEDSAYTQVKDSSYGQGTYIVGYEIIAAERIGSTSSWTMYFSADENFEHVYDDINELGFGTFTRVKDLSGSNTCTVANFASTLASLKSASSDEAPLVKVSVTDCTESNIGTIYKALKVYEKSNSYGYPEPTLLVDLDLTQSTGLTRIPAKTFFGGADSEYDWTLGAFALYSIELPETLKIIETHAFWSCMCMEAVSIPGGLREIWYGAFSNCQGLKKVVLPADIGYIGNAAFSWTTAKISFDKEVAFDADKYWYFMTDYGALVRVCWWASSGNTVEPRGYHLIEWNNITGDVTIPSDIRTIGADALGGYYGVTSITIPSSVERVEHQNLNKDSNTAVLTSLSFEAAEGKKWIWEKDSTADLSDSVANAKRFTEAEDDAWDYCYRQIPEDCVYQDHFILSNDKSELIESFAVGDVVVPASVTKIRSNAFRGNSLVTSVTLPSSNGKWYAANDLNLDVAALSAVEIAQYLTSCVNGNYVQSLSDYAASQWIFVGNSTVKKELPYYMAGDIETDTEISPINVTEDTGISMSFFIKNYSSDWTMIFQTAVADIGLTCMIFPDSNRCYPTDYPSENSPAKSYDVFLNSYCYVTISISSTGITFYKNGKKMFNYDDVNGGFTSYSSITMADLCKKIIKSISVLGIPSVHPSGDSYTISELYIAGSMTEEQAKARVKEVFSSSLFIALGGENTLNLSSVKIDDVEQTVTHAALAPSSWYAINEFETVKISKGSSVSFTFTQPTQGVNPWNSWSLAFYDENDIGQFMRGDNWLNNSRDATFTSGLWNEGNSSANGTWSNGYTYETCASKLPTDAVVVVNVVFDGSDVVITETIDGVLAYTASSENW